MIPDYQTLMLPVLRQAARGERRVPEVAERIADELGLTADEREELLPSGRQRILHNRIHWAKFYLGKAGLVASPERIDVDLLMQFASFREFYKSSNNGTPTGEATAHAASARESSSTPEEQIEAAHKALDAALRGDLIERILQNGPSFFEQLIVDLLVAMGYGGSHRNAAEQMGRTGDGGVDGVINEDRLGLDRVYVQAKRYAGHVTVGRPDVQAFVGSLVELGATKGVFVTTSTFSAGAQQFVQHLAQRVVLIDGARLASLMIEHGVGVRTHRIIEFKRLDEDFFSEE